MIYKRSIYSLNYWCQASVDSVVAIFLFSIVQRLFRRTLLPSSGVALDTSVATHTKHNIPNLIIRDLLSAVCSGMDEHMSSVGRITSTILWEFNPRPYNTAVMCIQLLPRTIVGSWRWFPRKHRYQFSAHYITFFIRVIFKTK